MKLYYLAGSCALGPHIALEYCSLAYDAVRIERGKQTDPAYLAINPLGRVPSLVTSTHGTITEAPAVLSYIADLAPGLRLLPPPGNPDRYQALRWMAYISSTVHPALGRFWRAERFCDDASCAASIQHAAATQLADDFACIERQMSAREWIVGDHLTVADLHLFVFGRLGLIYCFVIVRLDRRDLVCINVTTNPTAEWVARQITEAFPWDPRRRSMDRGRRLLLAHDLMETID